MLVTEGEELTVIIDEFLGETIAKLEDADGFTKTIEEKKKQLGDVEFYQSLKRLFLQTIDMFWIEHLEVMEYLRGSVNLRAYGQRDPLVEYKKEGLKLFKDMQESVDAQIVSLLPSIGANQLAAEEKKLRDVQRSARLLGGSETGDPSSPSGLTQMPEKIGRNDKVTLVKGAEKIEVKFKKADTYLREGWVIKV